MDNQPFQAFQPQPQTQPTPTMPPTQPIMPGQPIAGQIPTAKVTPEAEPKAIMSNKTTMWMIFAIVAGVIAITFVGLFIWMYVQWSSARSDVEGEITAAVATAVNEKTEELENQFTEREKSPYKTFAGPIDYGELSFEYPKTWSVYENRDASSGGDYEAYLNPDKVYPVSSSTINALRVIIKDQSYDDYIKTYESNIKSGKLTVSVRMVNGENTNLYAGEQPSGGITGIAAVFKIRDKTVILQTDAMLFENDFQTLLDTVRFNQ